MTWSQPSGEDKSPKRKSIGEEDRQQGLVATGEPGGVWLPHNLTQGALLHPCTCWRGSSDFYSLFKQQRQEGAGLRRRQEMIFWTRCRIQQVILDIKAGSKHGAQQVAVPIWYTLLGLYNWYFSLRADQPVVDGASFSSLSSVFVAGFCNPTMHFNGKQWREMKAHPCTSKTYFTWANFFPWQLLVPAITAHLKNNEKNK